METFCRHGTQQWKNTVLPEFMTVHFQCILFYFFKFLIHIDYACVVYFTVYVYRMCILY